MKWANIETGPSKNFNCELTMRLKNKPFQSGNQIQANFRRCFCTFLSVLSPFLPNVLSTYNKVSVTSIPSNNFKGCFEFPTAFFCPRQRTCSAKSALKNCKMGFKTYKFCSSFWSSIGIQICRFFFIPSIIFGLFLITCYEEYSCPNLLVQLYSFSRIML